VGVHRCIRPVGALVPTSTRPGRKLTRIESSGFP
jgi:hypothetical protein